MDDAMTDKRSAEERARELFDKMLAMINAAPATIDPDEGQDQLLALFAEALRSAEAEGRAAAVIPSEGHDEPCSYCHEPCDSLSARPSRWPLYFPDADQKGTGKGRWHHVGCVVEKIAAGAAAEAQVAMLKDDKGQAYFERNNLVAALAHMFPSGIAKTDIPGWSPDWHGCVYIDLPTGQVSYHYHDSQAHLFADLPSYQGQWDGHGKDEVHRRLGALSASILVRDEALIERGRQDGLLEAAHLIDDFIAEDHGEKVELVLRELTIAIAALHTTDEKEDK